MNQGNNKFNKVGNGGLHSQNANGGVLMGPNDSVEEGETVADKYVYSNRLTITPEAAKQFNLPKTAIGKTYAKFTDSLNNYFKDRPGMPEQNTLKAGLDRAKAAQEQERARMAAQIQQSQNINATQVPDTMNGQIPQGMEGYVEPRYAGGQIDTSTAGSLASLGSGLISSTNPDSEVGGIASSALSGAAAGSMLGPWGMLGGAVIGAGTGLSKQKQAKEQALEDANLTASQVNKSFSDPLQRALGGYLTNQYAMGGGLSRGSDYGSEKKPYPSVDSSDFAGGGRSYPIPTKADAVDALRLAGLHGRSDVRSKVFAKYPELKHAYGGSMAKEAFKYAYGGEIEDPTNPLYKSTTTIPQVGATLYPTVTKPPVPTSSVAPPLTSNLLAPSTGQAMIPYRTPNFPLEDIYSEYEKPPVEIQSKPWELPSSDATQAPTSNPKLGLSGKQLGRAATLGAMLAPAVGNMFQKVGKAEVEIPYINTRRFQYTPVDENQLQNIAKNEMSNTLEAMKASGASPTEMRAAILGSGITRTKGVSDALMAARQRNQELQTAGQQFDLGIDEANIGRRMTVDDMNARNRAAAAREKSEKLAAITGNIADVGKFASGAEKVKAMTGYNQYGDYVQNPATNTWFTLDGKPASVQDVLKSLTPEQRAKYLEDNKAKAYGGYLFNNKRK